MAKRLQSIKLPRDLTLGGTKPKRPAPTPNLNVTRNKEKSIAFLKNSDDKHEKRFNNKRDRTNNRRTEQSDRFLQSSGIFSDGIGSDAVKKARYERVSGGGSSRDDSHNYIPVPNVKKEEWKVDDKNENKVYNEIVGYCDNSSDDSDSMPFKPLPWDDNYLKEATVPLKHDAKLENDAPVVVIAHNKIKLEQDFPLEYLKPDIGTGDKPNIALWSMPDSFAGKGLCDDPSIKKLFDYKLSNMQEGQIGKIFVRRSGKIDVYIGGVKFDLEPTHLESFQEEIVKINESNDSKDSTSSVVIGEIQNRYSLTPNWESLLEDS